MGLRAGVAWYYRTFGWPGIIAGVGKRTVGWPRTVTTRPPGAEHPFTLRVRTSDERVYTEIFLRGAYAVDLAFTPQVILDAGANIGAATVFFANRYPNATIIAVEPEASNFALLVRNVRPYSRVLPIRSALWNHNGEIGVSPAEPLSGVSGPWAFVTREEAAGDRVPALTPEALMRQAGVSLIDLAKVDIEGAELELFQSAEWLSGVRCLMIETHDRFRPGCSAAVNAAMGGFGQMQRGEATIYMRP